MEESSSQQKLGEKKRPIFYFEENLNRRTALLVGGEVLLGNPRAIVSGSPEEFWVGYNYPAIQSGVKGISRFETSGKLVSHYFEREDGFEISAITSTKSRVWAVASGRLMSIDHGGTKWLEYPYETGAPWSTWKFSQILETDDGVICFCNTGAVAFCLDSLEFSPFFFPFPMGGEVTGATPINLSTYLLVADEEHAYAYLLDTLTGQIIRTADKLPPYPQTVVRIRTGHVLIGCSGATAILAADGRKRLWDSYKGGSSSENYASSHFEAIASRGLLNHGFVYRIMPIDIDRFTLVFMTTQAGLYLQILRSDKDALQEYDADIYRMMFAAFFFLGTDRTILQYPNLNKTGCALSVHAKNHLLFGCGGIFQIALDDLPFSQVSWHLSSDP